jgi:hypothetical protein
VEPLLLTIFIEKVDVISELNKPMKRHSKVLLQELLRALVAQ